MKLNGKRVELHQLRAEIIAAGIAIGDLGTAGDELVTYDADGHTMPDLPSGIAAVLAAHVAPLPLTAYVGQQTLANRVTTVGTVPAELFRQALAPLTVYRARVELFGVDRANGNTRDIEAKVTAKRLGAGAILVPNAAAGLFTLLADHRDAAAGTWTILPSVSGADFVITVVGSAGRTVDWFCRLAVDSFTPAGLP